MLQMQVHNNFPLSGVLWYKIGGSAKHVLDVNNSKDLLEALDFIKRNKIDNIFLLGLGSNLLFSNEGFDGAIIRFIPQEGTSIKLRENNIVECFAGEELDSLIQFGFRNNLSGLEWAGGLPGTIGAAVRGNVGAFGGEIKDIFYKAHVIKIRENGEYEKLTLKIEDIDFSYRNSKVKKDKLIVVSAQFSLKIANDKNLDKAKKTYYEKIAYRNLRHPVEYPNCGSIFKNITKDDEINKVFKKWPDIRDLVKNDWNEKVSMRYVIDRLGLTGYKVGNAQISDKHQNFIINLGGANSEDVKLIVVEIERKMQEVLGFTPEIEIEII